MKMNRILLLCSIILLTFPSYGQKIKVVSGKLDNLKGISALRIEYDYSNLGVGKFDVEAEYVEEKVNEMNEDEAGTGDLWKEKWFEDRPAKYEPKFEELLSDYAPFIQSGKDMEAEITLNVHTTFIEPGFNVGVSRKPALINLELTFYNKNENLLVISMLKSPGNAAMGFDYDAGYRISEAYAKAGKSLGKYLTKSLN